VLKSLVAIQVLSVSRNLEQGTYIDGYLAMDTDAARNIHQSDEAVFWLLAPNECEPPVWVQKRIPPKPDEEQSSPSNEDREGSDRDMQIFTTVMRKVSEQLGAIQDSYRRIEDRVNKLDFRAVEARDQTLQLVASAVSDLRQCTTEMRQMNEESSKLALDTTSHQEQFLARLDQYMSQLASGLKLDHDGLIRSLDLYNRYVAMTAHLQGFTGALKPLMATLGTMTSAAESLEVGVETAMDLARKIEESHNGAAR
jgi:uncharacterized protein YoxC